VTGRSSSPDVAIVGGGIVGAAAASFLARAGARVALYERTAIAAGASGRNSGVIQQPLDSPLAALYRESLALYRTLDDDAGGGVELGEAPAGLLYVGRDRRVVEALAATWRTVDPVTQPEVIGGAELRRVEPALADDLVACRLRLGYPVAPAAATLAFAIEAERAGASIVVGPDVRLVVRDGVAVGVGVGGDVRAAGAVLVTAGPWTPGIIDPTGSWLPIQPIWGVVAEVALDDAPTHVLEEAGIGIEPPDGQDGDADAAAPGDAFEFSLVTARGATSLGSTFLAAEPRPGDLVDRLRARGAPFVPGLARAPLVAVRSCARPVSLDGRPLVGAVPWLDRVFVAAGHGPWGISTGPATARLISDLVLGSEPAIPAVLDPARFGVPG
jgi:glycine/D-amino acid oxidase-like deaminating enzyme